MVRPLVFLAERLGPTIALPEENQELHSSISLPINVRSLSSLGETRNFPTIPTQVADPVVAKACWSSLPRRFHVVPEYPLDRVLTAKPHHTILATETVLASSDRFDNGDSPRDECVTHRILDHLVLFFILGPGDRFLPTIPNRSVESTEHLPK